MFTSGLNFTWGGQDARVPGIAGILPAKHYQANVRQTPTKIGFD